MEHSKYRSSPTIAYDPAVKEQAVSLAIDVGFSEAGRRLDIPGTTIATWARNAGIEPNPLNSSVLVQRWARQKSEFADGFARLGLILLERAEAESSLTQAKNAAIGAAVCLDKAMQARGEATKVSESTHLRASLDPKQITELLAEVSGRRDSSKTDAIPVASRVVATVSHTSDKHAGQG